MSREVFNLSGLKSRVVNGLSDKTVDNEESRWKIFQLLHVVMYYYHNQVYHLIIGFIVSVAKVQVRIGWLNHKVHFSTGLCMVTQVIVKAS